MRFSRGWKIGTGFVFLAGAVAASFLLIQRLPPRFIPWAPLDIADDLVPVVTRLKLERIRVDRDYCAAALATADFHSTPPGDQPARGRCTLDNVTRVSSADHSRFSSAFTATCPLAVAIGMFIEHDVEPIAERDLHTGLANISHFGSYACRAVVGGHGDELSQHAYANAIDIASFTLQNGTVVTVAKNWRDPGDTGKFLHDVRDRACTLFSTVLSPDYNASHQTHFHLDMAPYRLCR